MNTQKKLKWGILGAARINQRLLPAIVTAANAQLVAVASRRPGAAAETIANYSSQQENILAYDNPDELLAHQEIEAVYLPMANEEHAEWAIKAIEAGKHVLIEKPMAMAVSDIDGIEKAAAKHKVKVMEGFMYRFHPQHERVKRLIAQDLIGEVRSARTCFAFMMKPARLYRIARDIDNGGGAMWDIGCYALHTARMFFDGSPLAVTAQANFVDSGADVSCCGTLDFGEGKFAQFDFSFEHARRSEYEIIGTKGGIKCSSVWAMPGDTPEVSWWTEAGELQTEKLMPANHFELEIEHFSNCVLNDSSPQLDFKDARDNCRTIVASLQAIKTGQRVTV